MYDNIHIYNFSGKVCSSLARVSTHFSSLSSASPFSPARWSLTIGSVHNDDVLVDDAQDDLDVDVHNDHDAQYDDNDDVHDNVYDNNYDTEMIIVICLAFLTSEVVTDNRYIAIEDEEKYDFGLH